MSQEGTTQQSVLEAVRKVTGEISARANEIEDNRAVPADIVDKLMKAGAFRMLLASKYGGAEVNLQEAVRVLEEVSRADGSAGWTVMVGTDFHIVISRFPRETVEAIYANGPDVMARGAFAPKGIAVPTEGGYILSGQWPLASGSYDFQWVGANCVVMEGGQPRMGPAGAPEVKLALLPAEKAEFLDTWDSVGLVGTKSEDFVLKEVFVPEEYTTDLFGPASVDAPLYRPNPFGVVTAPTHCAVVVGIAQGALDDLSQLAAKKRPAFNPGALVSEDPIFIYRLGELATRLSVLRGYVESQTMMISERALAGDDLSPLELGGVMAMGGYAHAEGCLIVNEAFALAGSTAVYRNFPLQRRWRDVRCVSQHIAASTAGYSMLGSMLAAQGAAPQG